MTIRDMMKQEQSEINNSFNNKIKQQTTQTLYTHTYQNYKHNKKKLRLNLYCDAWMMLKCNVIINYVNSKDTILLID